MNVTAKKLIPAIVILIWILVFTSACANTAEEKQSQDNTPAEQTESTTEITDELPEIDMNGYELNMLNFNTEWFTWGDNRILAEEQTGDIVDDAIYTRQRKIEDRFNCVLKINEIENTTDTVKKNVLAGDNIYQVYSIYEQDFGALVPYFMDCNELPYLKLDEKHWNPNATSIYEFSGKQLALGGNISLSVISRAALIVFNKEIYRDYVGGESLYSLVRDNKWTIDAFLQISSSIGKDLNGDGGWTEDDLYGLSNTNFKSYIGCLLSGAELGFTDADKTDGIPTFNLHKNEPALNLVTKLMDALSVNGFYYNKETAVYDSSDLFTPGKSLFVISSVYGISTLRAMENDIGILPLPKYSDKQEQFYAPSFGSTLCVVPTTVDVSAEGEYIGAILEAMSFSGYYDILPQYKEVFLKTKSARDDESADMLDIIFDSVNFGFDMNLLFDSNLQFSILPALWQDRLSANIVSACEKNSVTVDTYIAKFFESVDSSTLK